MKQWLVIGASLLVSFTLLNIAMATTVYQSLDSQGNVAFSTTPSPNATAINVPSAQVISLPPLNNSQHNSIKDASITNTTSFSLVPNHAGPMDFVPQTSPNAAPPQFVPMGSVGKASTANYAPAALSANNAYWQAANVNANQLNQGQVSDTQANNSFVSAKPTAQAANFSAPITSRTQLLEQRLTQAGIELDMSQDNYTAATIKAATAKHALEAALSASSDPTTTSYNTLNDAVVLRHRFDLAEEAKRQAYIELQQAHAKIQEVSATLAQVP